jgi:hypothetical protein
VITGAGSPSALRQTKVETWGLQKHKVIVENKIEKDPKLGRSFA